MGSKFWDNVRIKLNWLNETQKWLSLKSGVGHTVINSGIARASSPSVDNAYVIARVLGVTVEELVDSEAGIEYIRQYATNTLGVYKPPERIADIVESILLLDDRDLNVVRGAIAPMLEAKKGKKTGTEYPR